MSILAFIRGVEATIKVVKPIINLIEKKGKYGKSRSFIGIPKMRKGSFRSKLRKF